MGTVKIVQRDTFDIIMSAVNKTVDLIRGTYGPSSNKVIISKNTHKLVVDDGVQIARDLELEDPCENAVLNVIRETAVRTNDRVGDGTTGSLIMLQAILNEVAGSTHKDGRSIEKELKKGFDEAKKQLLSMAKPVKTKAELEQVARVSFDDAKIAELIAEAWYKLGKDGVLTVDRSGTMETFVDMTDGIKIDRGYLSPYMVTNPQRMEGVIEKPYILLTDYRLTEASDIVGVMNMLAGQGINNLVVVCDNMEQSALATAIVNRVQGKFTLVAVSLPAVENKSLWLEDLAILVGARVFSEKKGDKLEEAKLEDLGRAQRFIARTDESVVVSPKSKKGAVNSAIKSIKSAIATASNEKQKKALRERIARFGNKIAVVKVGAVTENEERALRYKVEDAINAVHSAFKGGVVAGGGFGLASIQTSSRILNNALKRPLAQLADNVGIELKDISYYKKGEAFNVVTRTVGDFRKVGVVDPVEVLIAGVESAVSIASLLVTASGMIVEEPPKPKTE